MTSDSLYNLSEIILDERPCTWVLKKRRLANDDRGGSRGGRCQKNEKTEKEKLSALLARVDIACLYSSLRYISIDCFQEGSGKILFLEAERKIDQIASRGSRSR